MTTLLTHHINFLNNIMETENKVTFGRVVSASVRVDNSSNKERQYGITAHVDIQGGKVTNVHQGVVTDLETNAHIADFSSYGNPEQLNVTYQTSAGRGPILAAVEGFIANTAVADVDFSIQAK